MTRTRRMLDGQLRDLAVERGERVPATAEPARASPAAAPSATTSSAAASAAATSATPGAPSEPDLAALLRSSQLGDLQGGTEVDERGRVLNEEGLPFVDVVESEAEAGGAGARAPPVAPPSAAAMAKDERRRWMDDVFAQLEREETHAGDSDDESASGREPEQASDDESPGATSDDASRPSSPPPAATPSTPLPSAQRPAPLRSVLKRTNSAASVSAATKPAAPTPGFQRGFLNLNPSSPGPERSNDPFLFAAGVLPTPQTEAPSPVLPQRPAAASAPTSPAPKGRKMRFLNLNPSSPDADGVSSPLDVAGAVSAAPVVPSAMAEAKARASSSHTRFSSAERSADEGDEERLTRSLELPAGRRKQVRIKSPARPSTSDSPERRHFARGGRPLAAAAPVSARIDEAERKDAEEEARRIVELLGPGVARGHPNAPPNLDELERARGKEQQERPPLPPVPPLPKGPTMKDAVVERKPALQAAPMFKRGFLNRSAAGPSKAARERAQQLPVAPRRSQGVSALERAAQVDDEEEAKGRPQLPHARPSKAFAEKLEKRRAGEALETASPADDDSPAEGSRVRFAAPAQDGEGESEPDPQPSSEDEAWMLSSDEESSIDLDALAPSFDSFVDDLQSAELVREYELAKAGLAASRERAAQRMLLGGGGEAMDDTDEEEDGTDIVPPERPEGEKVSRFKASRVARAAGFAGSRSHELSTPRAEPSREEQDRRADEAGHELAHMLEDAQNVGPAGEDPDSDSQPPARGLGAPPPRVAMVIPTIAPVRYPKNARELLQGERVGPVDLEGESEDEDALQGVMRARLEEQEMRAGLPRESRAKAQDGPPEVRPAAAPTTHTPLPDAAPDVAPVPGGQPPAEPKRVSRFKAARQSARGA